MNQYGVILSHADEPQEGVLCYVTASSPGSAQDECNRGVQDEGSIFHGYDFTIWPVPVA